MHLSKHKNQDYLSIMTLFFLLRQTIKVKMFTPSLKNISHCDSIKHPPFEKSWLQTCLWFLNLYTLSTLSKWLQYFSIKKTNISTWFILYFDDHLVKLYSYKICIKNTSDNKITDWNHKTFKYHSGICKFFR